MVLPPQALVLVLGALGVGGTAYYMTKKEEAGAPATVTAAPPSQPIYGLGSAAASNSTAGVGTQTDSTNGGMYGGGVDDDHVGGMLQWKGAGGLNGVPSCQCIQAPCHCPGDPPLGEQPKKVAV